MKYIKHYAFQPTNHLDRFSGEFIKCMKLSLEEDLYFVLGKILCINSLFKSTDFEKDFNSFLGQLHTRFFNSQNV